MPDDPTTVLVPSLKASRNALTSLATSDALQHLEAALQSLQGLSESLQKGDPMAMEEKRQLERALLRFRVELQDAKVLADRGLAFCQDWALQLEPPPSYQANGAYLRGGIERHELSLDA